MIPRILLALILFSVVSPAFSRTANPGEHLTVYLLTFGPGDEAWEKFGHNAIWVHDDDATDPRAADIDYNWGVFDFGTGISGLLDFIGRFVQGRLLYSMSGYDPRGHTALDTLADYRDANRSVLVQRLDLTPEEKASLQAALIAQDTPANRHYLYDYYVNNCSTKVRDALDRATNGQIKPQLIASPTGTTFRSHTSRLTADTLWLYTCLYYVLGHPVDHPLSAWQESFLPEKLALHLRSVTIDGHPLFSLDKQLFTAKRIPERDAPPDFLPGFLAVGIILGALMLACVFAMKRWRRTGFAAFTLLAITWSLLAGAGGAISTWGILFTDHTAARYNENLMQCAPISLLLVVFAPLARQWKRTVLSLAAAALALSLLGLLLKITPWFWQTNANIIALALPAHLGLMLALIKLTKEPRTSIGIDQRIPFSGRPRGAVLPQPRTNPDT